MSTTRRLVTTIVSLTIAAVAAFAGANPAFASTPVSSSTSSNSQIGALPKGCSARSYKLWGVKCAGFTMLVYNGTDGPDATTITYKKTSTDGIESVSHPSMAPGSAEADIAGMSTPMGPESIDASFDASGNGPVVGYYIYVTTDYFAHTAVSCGSVVLENGSPTRAPGEHCEVQAAGAKDADGTVHLTSPAEGLRIVFE